MQNFFEKLSKTEVESLYKKNFFDKCQLTIDHDKSKIVIPIKLVSVENEKFGKIYVLPFEVVELLGHQCAFSFRIGTRMFFFKAEVQMDHKGFFVEIGFEILELKRRRHTRFDISDNFEHNCSVITSLNKSTRVDARLTNFSESGAKLKVDSDLILFQKNNHIILSIKAGKRAAFLVGCQIRFVSRRLKEKPELGVEFVNLTDIKKSRILNICEDLSRLVMQTKRIKKNSPA